MQQRLPGTDLIDTFEEAPAGCFMSLPHLGIANTTAELILAQIGASYLPGSDRQDIIWPTQDFPHLKNGISLSHVRYTNEGTSVWIFEDFSCLISIEKVNFSTVMPFACEIDKIAISHAVDKETGQRARSSPSLQVCGNKMLHWTDAGLNAQKTIIGQKTFKELLSDARDLIRWRKTLGTIQTEPRDDDRSFFPPLMTLTGWARSRDLPLQKVIEAELHLLGKSNPSLEGCVLEVVVRGSMPERNGMLRPPDAHLLIDKKPMADESEIQKQLQPVLDAYCTDPHFFPDLSDVCEYQPGKAKGQGNRGPALVPAQLFVVRPRPDYSAHEQIELFKLAQDARSRLSDAISRNCKPAR